jgi:predicted transcriptional regulator
MAKNQQHQRPPKKTVIVGVRLEEDLAQRLQELADADERKLSPFIARVLRKYVGEMDKKSEYQESD